MVDYDHDAYNEAFPLPTKAEIDKIRRENIQGWALLIISGLIAVIFVCGLILE